MANEQEPSEFGRWLKAARGEAGLTQEGLAELSSVHVNTIKSIEIGKVQRPTTGVSAALKRALGEVATPEEAREAMDKHTQSFLDLVGAYLMTLPPKERLARVFKLTREILRED